MARRRSAPAVAALLLAGCAVGPDFQRPIVPPELGYGTVDGSGLDAGGQVQALLPGTELRADWWHLFGSPRLDALVARALAESPTLDAAEARLRQSQDELNAGEGVYFPRLDAAGTVQRERSAPAQTGSGAPGRLFKLVNLNVNIIYPLDLFGGARRALEGERAVVEAQGHALRAAALSLTANVVNTAIALAAYRAQAASQRALLAAEAAQLQGLSAQVLAGTAAAAVVLPLLGQMASDEAALAQLDQRAAQSRNLLALLCGGSPSQVDPAAEPALDELQLPLALPLSLPSALVRRRPDLRAAEAALHLASANVGVAMAAEFPSFGLSAGYGGAAAGFSGLSGTAARFWTFGAELSLPLLHGGTLRWQRQAAADAYEAQLAVYRDTVLAAFAQVADALRALQADAAVQRAQLDARRAAGTVFALQRAGHGAGLVAGTDVLAALVQVRRSEIEAIRALAQRQQDTVALFAALGGGWWDASAEPDAVR